MAASGVRVGVLQQFLDVGFLLREDIIKVQHKRRSTREKWAGSEYDFHQIRREHLFVFYRPGEDESVSQYPHSAKWVVDAPHRLWCAGRRERFQAAEYLVRRTT